jgi:hypothetical protein
VFVSLITGVLVLLSASLLKLFPVDGSGLISDLLPELLPVEGYVVEEFLSEEFL